jgi:hypothetical protein
MPSSVGVKIPWKCRRSVVEYGENGTLQVLDKVKLEARRRKIALQIFPTDRDIRKLAQEPDGTSAVLVAFVQMPRTARPRRRSPRTVFADAARPK